MTYQLTFDALHDYSSAEAVILPVTLRLAEEEVKADAFLDTGSTFCVFRRQLAELLGVDVESGDAVRLSTATGLFTAYGHTLTLETLGLEFETIIYFAALENYPRNVLGRRGWLDRVRVGIVEHDSKLYVSRYDTE
ncbi:MAG: retropepsin-like domain-containing protein [Acidobacteriota bacterium]|nr:retropepsin-like domain-containing protein [Acidobacteriota bacterium]